MGLVYSTFKISNSGDFSLRDEGYLKDEEIRVTLENILVDSGAISLCLNETIQKKLGLRIRATQATTLADGTEIELPISSPVDIEFENRRCTLSPFILPGNAEPLMGVVPLELMDILIDPARQQLIVNPEHPDRPVFKVKHMHSNAPSYANKPIDFTPEMMQEVQRFKTHYPAGKQKSAIIPLLHLVQKNHGWVPVEAQDKVAELLDLKPIEVYEAATFYTMFHLHPVGQYVLEVCRTGPCMIRGAEDICKYLESKLGTKEGEITADGLFTWRTVECLGACGYAPMMQVGDHFHEHLTPEKLDNLIGDWRAKN